MIIQINIFSCDICKRVVKETVEETFTYSDPLVTDSELVSFKKSDDHNIELYSGYACKECVSNFGHKGSDFRYFKLDNS